jgi:hypothetical protein
MFTTPNDLFTGHLEYGTDRSRGPSPLLWYNAAKAMIPANGDYGSLCYDDFLSAGGPVAANVGGWGGYKTYEDTACSILQRAGVASGILRLSTDATDNNEVSIGSGYGVGTLGAVGTTTNKLTIFECRFKLGQVADTVNDFFIGLHAAGCIVTDGFWGDTGTIVAQSLLGFWVARADGDSLKLGYKDTATALTVSMSKAIAADTFYKLGFVYDPAQVDAQKIAWYIDGVRQATYVTATQMGAGAALFPLDDHLQFAAALKNDTTTACTADIDWWAFYQAG